MVFTPAMETFVMVELDENDQVSLRPLRVHPRDNRLAAELAIIESAEPCRKLRSPRVRDTLMYFTSLLLLVSSVYVMPVLAQSHALIVSGIGGESAYEESFKATGMAMAQALQTLDTEDNFVVHLHEQPTRDVILAAIESAAEKLSDSESATFTLILIGHGTADSDTWRFNISGPDLTTEDLVAALNAMSSRQQLVVLAASASGATLATLEQPQRVVVTATKSGGESNAVRFPEFLAEAVTSNKADYDRNEILTVAEAFRFADARTSEYYEQQKLLASEHPRLRGDGATSMPLALLGSLKQAKDDPVVAVLLDERLSLEQQFKQLKTKKDDMSPASYYEELETLLIAIAQLQRSIDTETGWSEPDAES